MEKGNIQTPFPILHAKELNECYVCRKKWVDRAELCNDEPRVELTSLN